MNRPLAHGSKSLFRPTDRIELFISYLLCFALNIFFNYGRVVEIESPLLKSFLRNLMDHQALLVFLFSFIVVIFHYQFITRKKTEVFCRILVGDTLAQLSRRYMGESVLILIGALLVALAISILLNLGLGNHISLFAILLLYIVISTGWLRKKKWR